MGRKNKRKTNKGRDPQPLLLRNNNSNSNSKPPTQGTRLAFLEKSKRQVSINATYNEPLILPKKPNMTLDAMGVVPPKKRTATATAERLIRAIEMIEDIEKLQAGRVPSGEDLVDIHALMADGSYIRECVLWIRAYISSDFRVPCKAHLLFGSPLPSCWTHITSLCPLEDNGPQLMRVDALSFVILLAAAIRMSSPGRERFSLQIVHELHAHAEGNYDWLDFDDLRRHEETKGLDEAYLRFATAWVGIKRARALYRDRDQRTVLPFQSRDDVATQSKSLLRSIEIFAGEQRRYLPNSPVGHWNSGWVSSQTKHNGRHPWAAAVDFYNQMADCCLLADGTDDDFYRAAAGVEIAMSLIIGGKPLVGYAVPSGAKVQVLRDLIANNDWDTDREMKLNIGAPTPAAAREASAKERRRLLEGVPPTRLEHGETVIVPHWEVSRIWNFAMEAYARVEGFGYGQCVYGETSGWDIVESFLKGQHGTLVPQRYVTCPQVGFKGTRDKGSWPCDFCGKVESDLKQCSVCKKVQYCSRDCQKKAWKATHKHECIPAK
eukprot:CAMPEP_0181114906 /NCGR_PEP_ID=MMETSP1071-20121207/21152_1 /TAXON_ID=35127 /ORGANISM="Thalassiosira sp., Strain NH16" /LENGTH=547 /DNA_ID=CAMNT_0023199085 /DNA_START=138 /DNA_END=1781 /DNA_ORIENTATION=-